MPNPFDELPKEIPERSYWIGLPVGYSPGSAVPVHAPNLTDRSVPGLYHAVTQVPNKAATVVNRVSARIGAPALASGEPPKVTIIPQSTAVLQPLTRRIPSQITKVVNRAQLAVNNLLRR